MKSTKPKAKKKSKQSSKKWKCDCPDINTRTTPCKHLEAELNKFNTKNSIGALPMRDVDLAMKNFDPSEWIIPNDISSGEAEHRLRSRLIKGGLNQLEQEIVLYRFFDEFSFQEITKELGITTTTKTFEMFKEALKKLKTTQESHDENENLD